MFVIALPWAWSGYYVFPQTSLVRASLIITHVLLLVLFSYLVWPAISVSPRSVEFDALRRTYSFRIRNETSDDVYSVSPIFRVQGSADDNFRLNVELKPSTNVSPEAREPVGQSCTDSKGRRVLFPIIPQMAPGEDRVVTLTYLGNTFRRVDVIGPNTYKDPLPSLQAHSIPGGMEHDSSGALFFRNPVVITGDYFANCKVITEVHSEGLPR
jgi:hypothetical protein